MQFKETDSIILHISCTYDYHVVVNPKQLYLFKRVAQQYKNGSLHRDAPEALCSLSMQLRPLYVKMQLNNGIRKLTLLFVLRTGIVHTVYLVVVNVILKVIYLIYYCYCIV